MKLNKDGGVKCLIIGLAVVTLLGFSLQDVSGRTKLVAKEAISSERIIDTSSSILEETSTSTALKLDNSSKSERTEELVTADSTTSTMEVSPTRVNLLDVGVAEVGTWEEFAAALGDASITTISLKNDITLSGTLNNVNGIFDKGSVDTDGNLVYFFVEKAAISRTLVIDGGGFTFDFGNLAIGFSNGSVNAASYWNITLQNMDVKTTNLYAPFFYPNVYLANSSIPSENKGLTGANATNSKLKVADNARTIYLIDTFEELVGGIGMINITDIQFVDDIIAGSSVNLRFRVPTYNNGVDYVTNARTYNNSSGGTIWIYMNAQGVARHVVIEGDGYTLDVGAITFCFYDATVQAPTSGAVNWDITWQNMNTYHGNYWGMAEYYDIGNAAEPKQMMRYNNFTNRGAQLIESPLSKMEFAGNVDVRQEDSYTSKRKDGTMIRTWNVNNNNNQTISGSSAVFKKGAKVYISSTRGPVVHLQNGLGANSNFEIEEGANVELVRSGIGTAGQGANSVIQIEEGSLLVDESAYLKATSLDTTNPNVLYLQNNTSKLVVDKDAVVDLETIGHTGTDNGTLSRRNPIYMVGGTIQVNGSLNLIGTQMGNSGTHLFYAQNKVEFIVGRLGSLDIQSDSTNGAQSLMYLNNATSSFKFSDAKRVNLQKTTAMTGTGGLIYMANGGILDVSVQNVYQWLAGNMAGGESSAEAGFTYGYEPMSSMKLTYNGSALRSKTGNSMFTDTKDRFLANFTTQGQQRVLFEYVPAPSVEIQSISNDNPQDPGAITILGYARPGTFVRLWEDPKNGTTAALVKGTEDTVKTPITYPSFDVTALDGEGNKMYTDDPTKDFTVKADGAGDWSYTIASKDVKHFTANNVINAFGFNNLKSEHATQIVLDKTAPTGTPVKYYAVKGDAIPLADVFVKDASDTNPIAAQAKVNYAYNSAMDMTSLMEIPSTDEAPHKVQIDLSDSALDPVTGNEAVNTRTIEAELVVLDKPVTIDMNASEVTVEYKAIREMTDAELKAWIIKESGASGYKIDRGGVVDLSDKIMVSDLGGLNKIDAIVAADGNMLVSLTIPESASGFADYTTTVKVKVINLLSTLTVQFVNENDEPMAGYTLTITERNGDKLVVSDEVDLTDSQYGVAGQLAALELAGFEIVKRPEKETTFYLNNTEVTATYKVTGLVYLSSAPTTINFGNISYDAKVKRVDDGTYEGDLVVNDTRATKSKWLLGAKLQSQMTNTADQAIKLVDSLQYINGDDTVILNDGIQGIYQENDSTEKSLKVTNISDTWGKTKESNGIKLVVDPTKANVLKGTYTGVIEWQFMEATP
ncbi:pectate lyase-like adhesive domain-containing protein [uncultured Vagococcus sp.]|uniref:pectate lyase-like adhesive domain-containing protein n=1 Tax=uncultured Vagococcus sp. TaxID=189676 RepID=UPI0028D1448A|nr:pectate lyase-like adhesive domain-containing protein [uncultured Vagococcus sp.]